jgi:hypothetical protein
MKLKCEKCGIMLRHSNVGASHYYCPSPHCDVWIEVIEG